MCRVRCVGATPASGSHLATRRSGRLRIRCRPPSRPDDDQPSSASDTTGDSVTTIRLVRSRPPEVASATVTRSPLWRTSVAGRARHRRRAPPTEHASARLLDRQQIADRNSRDRGSQAAADQRRAPRPNPAGRARAPPWRRITVSRDTAAGFQVRHRSGTGPAGRIRPRAARPRCGVPDRREATTQPAVPPPITSQRVLNGDSLLRLRRARRLEREAGEVRGVVVAHQSPAVAARRDEFGQRRVRGL